MKKLIALLISITFLTLPACNRRSITQLQPTVEYDKRYEETPVSDTWLDKLNKGVGWTWDGTKAVGRWCLEHRTSLIISVVVIGGVISLASYLHGRTPTPQKEAEDNNPIPDLDANEPLEAPVVERSSINTTQTGFTLVNAHTYEDFDVYQCSKEARKFLPKPPELYNEATGQDVAVQAFTVENQQQLTQIFKECTNDVPLKAGDKLRLYRPKNRGTYIFCRDGQWYQMAKAENQKPFSH